MRIEREYYYDELGNEIHEGDLLRIWHFRGARGRVHYMYQTVIKEDWGERGLWWAAKMYYEDGKKGYYRLCATASEETGIIKGARIIARKAWDETFKIN